MTRRSQHRRGGLADLTLLRRIVPLLLSNNVGDSKGMSREEAQRDEALRKARSEEVRRRKAAIKKKQQSKRGVGEPEDD